MSLFCSLLLALSLANAAGLPAPNVHVGDPALLFSLPAVNEDAALRAAAKPHVALSDFTGISAAFPARAVIIHFVTNKGSEAQLATLNRLQKKYVNRGIRVLAIVADDGDLASLSEWVEGQRLDFPVLRDTHRIVVDRYGVQRFPMTVVVDTDGYIRALGAPKDDLEASLEAIIQPFLEN